MVFFNHAARQMTVKIVYYGPGLCGKTTNLNTIYARTSLKARGEMVSLNTETDRTLFFDLLPMEVGMVSGYKTRLQLYTVPGQVFYNSTRKLVLKGVDGIAFVVDSQRAMLDANHESLLNLQENLRGLGLDLADIPMVLQWNKRDLRNVLPLEDLEATFNSHGLPSFQAVASEGVGVFETLRGITRLALGHIRTHLLEERSEDSPRIAPLTLADLPSGPDLCDLEGAAASELGFLSPLPDEDAEGELLIEAPLLPDPPGKGAADIAFLLESDGLRTPTFLPDLEGIRPPAGGLSASVEQVLTEPRAARPEPRVTLASLRPEPRPPAPRLRAADVDGTLHSLVGKVNQTGRTGQVPALRLLVPAEFDAQEVEVVVRLQQQGRVVAEGQFSQLTPTGEGTARLHIELKRA